MVGDRAQQGEALAFAGRKLRHRSLEIDPLEAKRREQAVELGAGGKVRAPRWRPPMRLGRHEAHAPAPQRCGDFLALHPVEKDVAIGWIKVRWRATAWSCRTRRV